MPQSVRRKNIFSGVSPGERKKEIEVPRFIITFSFSSSGQENSTSGGSGSSDSGSGTGSGQGQVSMDPSTLLAYLEETRDNLLRKASNEEKEAIDYIFDYMKERVMEKYRAGALTEDRISKYKRAIDNVSEFFNFAWNNNIRVKPYKTSGSINQEELVAYFPRYESLSRKCMIERLFLREDGTTSPHYGLTLIRSVNIYDMGQKACEIPDLQGISKPEVKNVIKEYIDSYLERLEKRLPSGQDPDVFAEFKWILEQTASLAVDRRSDAFDAFYYTLSMLDQLFYQVYRLINNEYIIERGPSYTCMFRLVKEGSNYNPYIVKKRPDLIQVSSVC